MLFLDNAAPDSCCAERPLHILTFPRLVSTAATVREKMWEQIHTHTHRQTDRPTDRPTDYNNPSLRMRARGLMSADSARKEVYFWMLTISISNTRSALAGMVQWSQGLVCVSLHHWRMVGETQEG